MAAAFRARFGARVAIQHSGLSDGERHDQWHRIRRGDVDVVDRHALGGLRAAATPRAHHRGRRARHVLQAGGDAALSRPRRRDHARQVRRRAGASSDRRRRRWSRTTTPSRAATRASRSRARVLDRPLATVRVVNMRDEMAARRPRRRAQSAPSARRWRDRLERARAVARAAESPRVCRPRCSAGSAATRSIARTAACRSRCTPARRRRGARAATTATSRASVPRTCPKCAAPYLERIGFGTERVEAEIATLFPERARRPRSIATPSAGGAASPSCSTASRGGELDVLVGTQMIAKGHDFPQRHARRRDLGRRRPRPGRFPRGRADVSAADAGRRPRRSRRAGRRSHHPDALSRALQHPTRVVAGLSRRSSTKEIEFRQRDALSAASSRWSTSSSAAGASTRRWRARRTGAPRERAVAASGGFVILGPAPAPLTRLRGEHRAQFFLKGTSRAQAMRQRAAARPTRARLPRHRAEGVGRRRSARCVAAEGSAARLHSARNRRETRSAARVEASHRSSAPSRTARSAPA